MPALRFVRSWVEGYGRFPDHEVDWGGFKSHVKSANNGCERGEALRDGPNKGCEGDQRGHQSKFFKSIKSLAFSA